MTTAPSTISSVPRKPKPAAIGYCRVSTVGQADNGASLPVQKDAIRRIAKERGYKLARIYEDAGISGAKSEDQRPGLAEALADIRKGRADALIVAKLDRLFRDLGLQEVTLAEIRKPRRMKSQHGKRVPDPESGGLLISCDPEEDRSLNDPNDPNRALIRQILGAVAEWERKMIRLRMLLGKQQRRAEGRYVGGGRPYGWMLDHESKKLSPHRTEQTLMAFARELRNQGWTQDRIAAVLNTSPYRPRQPWGRYGGEAERSPQWRKTGVYRTLLNESRFHPKHVDPVILKELRVLAREWKEKNA